MRKTVSIYIDPDSYDELKGLCHSIGVSVSSKMNELIGKAVAELKGEEYRDTVLKLNYEALKKSYRDAIKELDSLEKDLKHKKVYEDLKVLAIQVGVDTKDFTNVQEISGPFLEQWPGRPEHAHLFIDLMECVQRKHKIEHQLEGIRKKVPKI